MREPRLLQTLDDVQEFVGGNEFQGRRGLVVAHHAFHVDDHEGPLVAPVNDRSESLLLQQGGVIEKCTVCRRHTAEHVAQQRVGKTEFFGPRYVGVIEIDTDTQYLGIRGFELGQIKLESQRFLRSNARKGPHVKEKDQVLLPDKVR